MNTGWNCPNCGKAHAPHVDTCPEGGYQYYPGITPPPIWSSPPWYPSPYPHPYITCETFSIVGDGTDEIQSWSGGATQ